jgi:hypothetical protein
MSDTTLDGYEVSKIHLLFSRSSTDTGVLILLLRLEVREQFGVGRCIENISQDARYHKASTIVHHSIAHKT